MTENEKNPSKIIDLQPHQDARNKAFDDIGELLQACRGATLNRLGSAFNALFERADDALFDFGEKADTNSLQMRYFDDLRELRRKRSLVERLFHQGVARSFSDFTTRRDHPGGQETAGDKSDPELSLLGEEELEENLTFTNMVSKAENRLPQELHGLSRRFGVLSGGASVEAENNPVGPMRICHAFQHAAREFEIDSESRLVLYKLFDRFVLSELGPLYDELNSMLIEAGVLPQLKTPLPKRPEPTAEPKGAAIPGATPGRQARPAAEGADSEVIHTIRGLLASRHEKEAGPETQTTYRFNPYDEEALTGGRVPVAAFYAQLDLVNALAVLQGELARSTRRIEPGAIEEIKKQLVDHVSKLSGTASKQSMSSDDEDTIDLVGMLFEFILTDRNLPDTIQALLGRLQIPYLKIALMDRRFFLERSQPARRLLDEMARAGIGWTPENDKDQKLINKLRETVNRILNEFDDDVSLFDTLLSDFNAFLAKYRRMASATEKRTTEAVKGRERLQLARQRAALEIGHRLKRNKVPESVQRLLARPWANVLVLTLLRHGEESQQWAQALQVADDLIWCSQPKPDEADRMRMIELIYPIHEVIREGLVLVALHEDEIERILTDLTECFEAVLTEEPIKRDAIESSAEAAEAHAPDWVMEMTESALAGGDGETAQAADDDSDDEAETPAVDPIESLVIGTWVEFRATDSSLQRAKLSWISPITQRYLFVNQKGLKVADKTRPEIVQAFADNELIVLDEVPIFDRAMDAIAEKLKGESADTTDYA